MRGGASANKGGEEVEPQRIWQREAGPRSVGAGPAVNREEQCLRLKWEEGREQIRKETGLP